MYRAENPAQYLGRIVGDGHCVALVREACKAPHTSKWKKGEKVNSLTETGTAIATFGSNNTYENKTDGSSHAAILVAAQLEGLQVIDQWIGHPTARRMIRFKQGEGDPVNDGDAFYVIS